MKYVKIINELRNKYMHGIISKEDLFVLYKNIFESYSVN